MTLPIDEFLPEIVAATRQQSSVVLKAEPGAGKTTRFPESLLAAFGQKILVLEPRRLAAKLAAQFVATGRDESVGDLVGYAIRHDQKLSAQTRLIFQTEGIFIRTLLGNPELQDVDVVVIDEFHERHIYTDEALALLRQLQKTSRPDLKLVLMSATIDTTRLEKYLGDCAVFDVPGRTFPVELEHFGTIHETPEQHFLPAVKKLWQDTRCPGNILAFCTGRAEIQNYRRLVGEALPGAKVLGLTADMPPQEQKAVFQEQPRKIILATNVAETSLTIPGVTGVLDLGRAKISSHAPWSGMPTLEVKKISKDSCLQRMGRAGRTQAGVCYRLFSEDDFRQRADFTLPEIQRIDLCQTLLDVLGILAQQGERRLEAVLGLPWFDPPDPKAVASATRTLQLLGALDADSLLTETGVQMSQISLHPRLARIVVEAKHLKQGALGCLAAGLLQEGGILKPGYRAFHTTSCDVAYQLKILIQLARKEELDSDGLARQVSQAAKSRVEQNYQLLCRQTGCPRTPLQNLVLPEDGLGAVLVTGYPDRVAKKRQLPPARLKKKRDQRCLFNLCLGRGAILTDESTVQKQDLLLALEATEAMGKDAAKGTLIRLASSVTIELLQEKSPQLVSESLQPRWHPKQERVEATALIQYGTLELGSAAVKDSQSAGVAGDKLTQFFCDLVKKDVAAAFPGDNGLERYHQKLALLERYNFDTAEFPRFEGELWDLFVEEICTGKTSYQQLRQQNLSTYLMDQLSWQQQESLRNLLPPKIPLGNGIERKVHYRDNQDPMVEGFIQDFFGVLTTPTIAGGRIPLVVQFLGPNKRPIQVTSDLKGYWRRGYVASRGELSRRYPKHHWPEDPTRAPPVLLKSRLKSND